MTPTKLLTPKQVARAIGVSEASVKRWCDRGALETTRTAGGHRRLSLDSVVRFLRESGHEIVEPEVLGLPSTTGQSDRIVQRGHERLLDALRIGHSDVATQVVFDLLAAGQSVPVLADLLFDTVSSLANGTPAFEVTRAVEICLQITHALDAEIDVEIVPGNASALCGALDGAPSTLNVTLATLVFRARGWTAVCLGDRLPFATLERALGDYEATMLYLNVELIRNRSRLDEHLARLMVTAESRGTEIISAGSGLAEGTGQSAIPHCADFQTLDTIAARRPKA